MRFPPHPALAAGMVLLLAACSSAASGTPAPSGEPPGTPTPSPPPRPTTAPATPTPAPTLGSTPSAPGPVVATFRVGESEEFRILLSDPIDIAIAEALLAGDPDELRRIPNGRVVRDGDGGVNAGWSWHIDPTDLDFVEGTIAVCDGLPSDVERGTVSGDRYCPWSAKVVSVEPTTPAS